MCVGGQLSKTVIISSWGEEAAGAFPLGVLVELILNICYTTSFANEGGRCLIFVKGLTLSECILDSSLNRPVSL